MGELGAKRSLKASCTSVHLLVSQSADCMFFLCSSFPILFSQDPSSVPQRFPYPPPVSTAPDLLRSEFPHQSTVLWPGDSSDLLALLSCGAHLFRCPGHWVVQHFSAPVLTPHNLPVSLSSRDKCFQVEDDFGTPI